jgi:hypothetical protein
LLFSFGDTRQFAGIVPAPIETSQREIAFSCDALDVFGGALDPVKVTASFNRQQAHDFTFLKPDPRLSIELQGLVRRSG